MTKDEIRTILKDAADRHGFTANEREWSRWPVIQEKDSHFLNFTITEVMDPDTDWASRQVKAYVKVSASLASMGGSPTPEELLKAAETIREGAELVQELQAMELSYTEIF